MSTLVQTVLIIFFILLSAFFAGSEAAFYSIGKVKVEALLRQNKKGAKILHKLKQNPKKVINTILLCNDFANIAASSIAAVLASNIFSYNGVEIAIGVMTFLLLTFGDMIPKNFASVHSEKSALFMAPIVNVFVILFTPFVVVLSFITKIILDLFKLEIPLEVTEEELWTTIEVGAGQKIISESEMRYLEGILRYKDVQAKEVMTPRIKIFALNQNMGVKDSVKKIIKKGYTRIPVYDGNIDKITGFVHMGNILAALQSKKPKKLADIKNKIIYISEEVHAKEAFSDMQKKHIPLSVVLDEFGGTEGIVTMEDLLEEIVGEVIDENDPRKSNVKVIDSNTLVVHGDAKVEFVDSFFKVDTLTKMGNYPNVAAVIEEKLKKLPQVKDRVRVGNLYMQVLRVKDNFPTRIMLKFFS